MKIRKLLRRAAAFALAAVTALSAVPATTAFAAGDIGTISFTHTYDGAGNAIRYNSSSLSLFIRSITGFSNPYSALVPVIMHILFIALSTRLLHICVLLLFPLHDPKA